MGAKEDFEGAVESLASAIGAGDSDVSLGDETALRSLAAYAVDWISDASHVRVAVCNGSTAGKTYWLDDQGYWISPSGEPNAGDHCEAKAMVADGVTTLRVIGALTAETRGDRKPKVCAASDVLHRAVSVLRRAEVRGILGPDVRTQCAETAVANKTWVEALGLEVPGECEYGDMLWSTGPKVLCLIHVQNGEPLSGSLTRGGEVNVSDGITIGAGKIVLGTTTAGRWDVATATKIVDPPPAAPAA